MRSKSAKAMPSQEPDIVLQQSVSSKILPKQVREYMAAIGSRGGKIGGKATTKRKADAARANGHKGGRPRKPTSNGRVGRKGVK